MRSFEEPSLAGLGGSHDWCLALVESTTLGVKDALGFLKESSLISSAAMEKGVSEITSRLFDQIRMVLDADGVERFRCECMNRQTPSQNVPIFQVPCDCPQRHSSQLTLSLDVVDSQPLHAHCQLLPIHYPARPFRHFLPSVSAFRSDIWLVGGERQERRKHFEGQVAEKDGVDLISVAGYSCSRSGS